MRSAREVETAKKFGPQVGSVGGVTTHGQVRGLDWFEHGSSIALWAAAVELGGFLMTNRRAEWAAAMGLGGLLMTDHILLSRTIEAPLCEAMPWSNTLCGAWQVTH